MQHLGYEAEIASGGTAGWADVDLSAYIPAGATGAMLTVINTSTTTARTAGARKNGSTTNTSATLLAEKISCFYVGVDENRVVELYRNTDLVYYVHAYCGSEAVFFTDPATRYPTTGNTWMTATLTESGGDTAQAAFLQFVGESAGFRRNGDTFSYASACYGPVGVICALDGSEQFQYLTEDPSVPIYIHGYLKSGVTAYSDPSNQNFTPASDDTWDDWDYGSSPIVILGFLPAAAEHVQFARRIGETAFLYEPVLYGMTYLVRPATSDNKFETYSSVISASRIYSYGEIATSFEAGDPRYSRPDSDVIKGAWLPSSGSLLWPMLDESDASPEDADYIYIAGTGTCEISLSTIDPDPGTSSGHVLRVRSRRETPSQSLRVTLLQNVGSPTLQIAQWTQALTASYVTYEFNLSGAQTDAITDYSALSVRLETI
jgi:hypothetical protein